jgi:hypothetical protein
MSEKRSDDTASIHPNAASVPSKEKKASSRRKFLGQLGGAAAAVVAANAIAFPKATEAAPAQYRGGAAPLVDESPLLNLNPRQRAMTAYNIRVTAAKREMNRPLPTHPNNGDEARYSTRIGSYSKVLPHTTTLGPTFGEVTSSAYDALLAACVTGNPTDWAAVPLGGTAKLTDPQGGLSYDLEGADAAAIDMPPPYQLASNALAAQGVEAYWMALARDIPFSMYGLEPITSAAITELNSLQGFDGPKQNGQVTAGTLFRGFTPGDLIGPYVSQFFVQPFAFGPLAINNAEGQPAQQYNCYVPNVNFMQDTTDYINVRNGVKPTLTDTVSGPCYLHDGRDLASFVHTDELYQAYFQGVLYCLDNSFAYNVGNPYNSSTNQGGFETFGNPAVVSLVAEVAIRALKAVWYAKFFVQRSLRPEDFGGLVQNVLAYGADYPLASQVLNSIAVQQMFALNSSVGAPTYLLAHAFPEGCPNHPTYGSGHATVAGICATILKAFFDEDTVIQNPVYSPDGVQLLPYTGSDAGEITVMTEANKIAANVGIGRAHAGIHFREDYQQSLLFGEKYAISILNDQRGLYNLPFSGYTFTKFDGTVVTV